MPPVAPPSQESAFTNAAPFVPKSASVGPASTTDVSKDQNTADTTNTQNFQNFNKFDN